jgi:hypothetical protein
LRRGWRIADLGLKLVAAVVAGPQMPDMTFVEILAPFWSEEFIATLRAGGDRT